MDLVFIIGSLSVIVGLLGEAFYLRAIFRRETHPHLYTWLIWSILATIGSLAQFTAETGPGVWALAITAAFSWLNMALCFKYGEKHITTSDKIALAASLTAIVPWVLTKDPLGSVILISIIDVVGFFPTIRKSWTKPHQENLTAYYFANAKLILAMFALEEITIITALYPAIIIISNSLFIAMCLWKKNNSKD